MMPVMSEEKRIPVPLLAAGALLLLFLVLLGIHALRRPAENAAEPEERVLSQPQLEALGRIEFLNPKMSAARNMLGIVVVYMDMEIVNRGDQPIRMLEVELEFYDLQNQVVHRDTARPVRPPVTPLGAGESRETRLAFDPLPPEWDRRPPKIIPVYVELGEM